MRLTVIDPTLRDRAGHNFDYAKLVAADARAAGFAVRVVAHAHFDVRDEALDFAVTPWFSSGLKDAPPPGLAARLRSMLPEGAARALAHLKRSVAPPAADADERALAARADGFSQQLQALLPELALGAPERLFFPTLSWADTIEATRVAGQARETLIMLRFDPPEAAWAQAQLKAAAESAGDRVHWLSDTRPLAEAYAGIIGKRVTVAPIPIDASALAAVAATRQRPPPVRVVFVGESRVEKGAAVLPAIVRAVLAHRDGRDINFSVQTLANIEGGEPGIAAALAELDTLAGPRVEILRGELSSEAFHHVLGRGHILLAPYDPAAYRMRSSGLIVQALAAGLAIVAPAANSWIARTLTDEGAASFCYAGGEDSIVRAVLSAAAHIRDRSIAPRVPAVARIPVPWAASMSH